MFQSLLPFLVFIVFIVVVGVALSRWTQRQNQQRMDALRAGAAARGWSCETSKDGVFDLTRWQGQTDGVRWTAEHRRLRHKRKGQTRTHNLRWWADGFGGPTSPLLLMGVPQGQETPALKLAQGEGLLATMAQKVAGFALDQSLDTYFGVEAGQQVDARALRMIEGAALPGFIALALDANSGAFWLNQPGHRAAIDAQVRNASSALSDEVDRPWVLLLGPRVGLARMAPVSSIADLERLVRAGVALVQAAG
jgi:hypothetical protein